MLRQALSQLASKFTNDRIETFGFIFGEDKVTSAYPTENVIALFLVANGQKKIEVASPYSEIGGA